MEMELPLESTTHLVGHSLREIESSLRDVLMPISKSSEPSEPLELGANKKKSNKKNPSGDEKHIAEIEAVLTVLEIPQTSPVAQTWLSLPGRDNEYGLAKRTHRNALKQTRPIDDEFWEFWDKMQAVLDGVLDRFEAKYAKVCCLLDELVAKPEPTDQDLKTLCNSIPNSFVTMSYFFERLQSPGWLNKLKEEAFFKNPPEPEVASEGSGIRFLPWPQSRYLGRMASQEPEMVQKIALETLKTGTKNALVHQDLAEAALVMPPKLAADWVKEATKWLKEQDYLYFSLPKKLGELIVYLADSKHVDAALGLARELLAVMSNPEGSYSTGVRTRCEDYYYENILEQCIPKLVSVAGEDTLRLLCNLLNDAIRFFQLPYENSIFEDRSYNWYRAFEGSWQNYRHDVRSLLAAAVWNATELIAKENPLKIRFLVQTLESYQWRIFDRIVLHLLHRFPRECPDLIAQRLANRKWLNEQIELHCYEYKILIKEHFANLDSEIQQNILRWLAQGPEDTSWVKEEKITLYIKHWQRDWLAILSGSLPREWQERYERLVLEIGPAKSLEPPGEVNFRQGLVSPKLAEELAAMTMAELFAFLKEWQWQPTGERLAPSRAGLAEELSQVIAQKPEDFIEEIEQFKEVDPEYIRSGFLRGLQNALKIQSEAQPKFYSWERVLEFCSWMLKQLKNEPETKASVNDLDYWEWNEICKAVIELIDSGLKVTGENQIPLQLRSPIWTILEQLTNDANRHPIDSVNTICGKAMHAVVQYALWVQQHLQAESDGEVKAARGFDEIPEVRSLLERHLDPKHDPSLTIRSVYGQWLLSLMRLDLNWTTRNLERIFPRNQDFQELRDSAWEGYITTYDPYNNIFPMLREEYSYAIERIDASTPERQNWLRANERLTEHLLVLYWRGVLKLGESDLLLERFFAKAPAHNQQAFMREIGRRLRCGKFEVDTDLLERLQKLWEWRVSEVRNALPSDSQSSDLKWFRWWFASRKFNSNWAIAQLMEVLRLAKQIDFDKDVLHHLVTLGSSMPLATVECLGLMADSIQGDKWFLSSDQDYSRAILSTALQSGDEETRKAAKELINRLLARNYADLWDL
jgi:hypothetical protein